MSIEIEIAERIARIETHIETILERIQDNKSHESRLFRLESEKKIWAKITHPILALVSGFFGGWIGRNH